MEPRFGHDFSQVRVHTDDKAAESARAVNARAYTVGMGWSINGRSVSHSMLACLPSSQKNNSYKQLVAQDTSQVVSGKTIKVTQFASPNILRRWTGSFNITTRLPKSRRFSVSSGSVEVRSGASWESSEACPESSNYNITLWQDVENWFDSNHGSETYPVPGADTKTWTELPSGEYYLEIYYPNTNPYCRISGNLNVTT